MIHLNCIRTDNKERGSGTLELVIVAAGLFLFIGLLIAGARLTLAHYKVQDAAFSAARQASLARSVDQARSDGTEAAWTALAQSGVQCVSKRVGLNTDAFVQPIGTIGQVRATITCTVSLSEAGLPGLPGRVDIVQSSSSPVDPYRQR